MKNNFFVSRLKEGLSKNIWDDVGEFMNKQKLKSKTKPYMDQILAPSETKDYELIFNIHQAMQYRKRYFEQYLVLIPILMKGFKDKETGQVFLLDELPPEKYNKENDYNNQ